MANEMVERIRAIIEPFLKDDPHSVTNTDDIVRDVIEAMREPTEQMIIAGLHEPDRRRLNARGMPTSYHVWQAMIDAARADESENV